MIEENILSGFVGREEALSQIYRYNLYKVMFYRDSLLSHSRRVFLLVKEILPYAVKAFGKKFDGDKALLMALIHDDPEIITGDIQMGNKDRMSWQELKKIEKNEMRAVEVLTQRFPAKIGKYVYKELLTAVFKVEGLEAQIVKYFDKFDALGEASHEAFAGNYFFTTNVINQYGKIKTPFEYYIPYLFSFPDKYPGTKEIFKHDFILLKKPEIMDFRKIAKQGQPHTEKSFQEKTGYALYDVWKEVILKFSDEAEIKNYYTQKEFLK